jgi:hypothetical protein
MTGPLILSLLLVASFALQTQAPAFTDRDRDGVPDELEQALLEKFRPTLLISAHDCDVLPAEFLAGSKSATVIRRNGTIYGQVFRPQVALSSGTTLEIHYYHLWNRDCGRMSHPLDAEHVAVLVRADSLGDPLDDWKAVYWYAAAHENTICDRSTIAAASTLGAENRGATAWISWGKHASYFSPEDCAGGCGRDRCENPVMPLTGQLINIGELGAPLKGAEWASSSQWVLAQKMRSAFSEEIVKEMNDLGPERVPPHRSHARLQTVVSAGGSSLDALDLGRRKTSAGVSIGHVKTGSALSQSMVRVQGSLKKAVRASVRWIDHSGTR